MTEKIDWQKELLESRKYYLRDIVIKRDLNLMHAR
jgi:hypothetical protein